MTRPAFADALVAQAERARLDLAAASYGEELAPFDAAMRGFMMRTLGPWFRDGACLQVGCAHGDQASLLLERFTDLTVLEPTHAFIAAARKRLPRSVRFIEGLIETAEVAARFDTILFSHVLEHVADPVLCLKRLAGWLTPSGRLCIVVPNAEAASRRIAVEMDVLPALESLSAADLAAGHRRVYSAKTLARDLGAAGLATVAGGGILFKPLANFQFDALIGGPLIGDAFLEGCYRLGERHPDMCASLYAVVEAPAS